jgi:hypothetical protein
MAVGGPALLLGEPDKPRELRLGKGRVRTESDHEVELAAVVEDLHQIVEELCERS